MDANPTPFFLAKADTRLTEEQRNMLRATLEELRRLTGVEADVVGKEARIRELTTFIAASMLAHAEQFLAAVALAEDEYFPLIGALAPVICRLNQAKEAVEGGGNSV
jgi:hypothetical protein